MKSNGRYDLHNRLGYKLALAARVNDSFLDGMLSGIGLTRQMWCVLIAIGEQNIVQPSDIASYVGINRTAVSRTLRGMEQKGLLKRSSSGLDQRSTDVSLTKQGRKALTASLPMAEKSMTRMREKLSSKEHVQLARLLDKFLDGEYSKLTGI